MPSRLMMIPAYRSWTRQQLQEHVQQLNKDFTSFMRMISPTCTRQQRERAALWMATQFGRWQKAGGEMFTICTAKQFEDAVGRLYVREKIDVPPYAELLLQGWQGVAFRHPEYHLARDLQLLNNLACDAEELLLSIDWRRPKKWAPSASENAQSLNRSTILTCFNLLEAFANGVARTYVMEHASLPESDRKKLLDDKKPLRSRVVSIPDFVAKKPSGLDVNKPPVSELFGAIKERRDAFVHCEPGPQESQRGYVKESAFHDVPWKVAKRTVELTVEIIERVWKSLLGRNRPSWLSELCADGRFATENLRLNPVFPKLEEAALLEKGPRND